MYVGIFFTTLNSSGLKKSMGWWAHMRVGLGV